MRVWVLLLCSGLPAFGEECRVLMDGTGCRTRQLAIERIFEKLPGVEEVTILPRSEAPADNQRYFIIRSEGASPSKEELIESLGRRAKHYHVLTVTKEGAETSSGDVESS